MLLNVGPGHLKSASCTFAHRGNEYDLKVSAHNHAGLRNIQLTDVRSGAQYEEWHRVICDTRGFVFRAICALGGFSETTD